jgi:hypothetical protein
VVTGYGAASQLVITLWFHAHPPAPVSLLVIFGVSFAFSAAALWCGLGMRERDSTRLRALIIVLWLYVIWSVGMNVWDYVEHFFRASPPPEWASDDILEAMKRSKDSQLVGTVFRSIFVIAEVFVVVWLTGQLSSKLVREEFK